MGKATWLQWTAVVGAVAGSVVAMTGGCVPKHSTPGGPVAAPRNKPAAVSSGSSSGTLALARQQLSGTWDLVALELAPAPGGQRVPVKASGTLTYDEFGNLTIDASTTDPATPIAAREARMLSFKGRAVIDTVNKELKLTDLTGNVDPNEVLLPEQRRRFEFENDLLKLSSIDERGQVTAIATWRRRH